MIFLFFIIIVISFCQSCLHDNIDHLSYPSVNTTIYEKNACVLSCEKLRSLSCDYPIHKIVTRRTCQTDRQCNNNQYCNNGNCDYTCEFNCSILEPKKLWPDSLCLSELKSCDDIELCSRHY